ncbi:arginine/serine-rich protein PNISR-like isoform X2 [Photinus pyralis]|uniref:arginine/serine-rich protein PNISR-like isoform X2 n=1 Tax=Photinus pyralis TaxID=7054 RepID=UPI0012672ACB|nr:arginine/serine-rich protein PNISR-like isoform X2 [Photinus pyralis]
MYSTSDSPSSQSYNNQQQWPLNPAAYQNTPNDQIDWAALAQQWIIMKEVGPPVPEQLLTPPPPPKINSVTKENAFEGGEAPMEVEKDDDAQKPNWNENNSTESWEWNQQQSWGWNNTWSNASSVPSPVASASKAPLLPTPSTFNQFSNSNENSNNYGSYNRSSSEYTGGYWTASGSKGKPHNKRYSKVNVSTRPTTSSPSIDPVMLDATKRKQLPAWIREGLEKMERDKQKQIERERVKQEKQEINEKSLFNEKEALEIIKSTVKERERSKFDSDGEDSPVEADNGDIEGISTESVQLTQEELMMKVRRTMTEILLKVTNQEIRAVCKEEFQRQLRKSKASDQRVSAPSGTNARGKLGLGMYGDSGSSSENSDDDYEHSRNNSDAELKDAIKRKKAEFSKTEREIEARLAAAEKHLDDSRAGTPKADSSDSQKRLSKFPVLFIVFESK